ncbi:hypothetical protein PSM7751_02006 [Pseudooceanicola marinus]|uniref:Uncharacterized protein n=1 Tax=Pseudooceanicola marinus TaxID=396013 RepID=A0A1X6Z925_9RHOB|nr:hypothetical protein [Pseudooceanicola marinus]SLN44101.1 hypothetical protein PSM7751_02006 [Pseudooceanicola marinus]
MTLLQKSYRGLSVLFELNVDLLLYAGLTALALSAGAYMGQILF